MKNIHKKGVYQCLGAALKRWLTPKCWLTPGENIAKSNIKSKILKATKNHYFKMPICIFFILLSTLTSDGCTFLAGDGCKVQKASFFITPPYAALENGLNQP